MPKMSNLAKAQKALRLVRDSYHVPGVDVHLTILGGSYESGQDEKPPRKGATEEDRVRYRKHFGAEGCFGEPTPEEEAYFAKHGDWNWVRTDG